MSYIPEAPVEERQTRPQPIECSDCGGVLDPVMGRIKFGTTIDWEGWVPGSYEHRERPDPNGPCAPRRTVSTFLGE